MFNLNTLLKNSKSSLTQRIMRVNFWSDKDKLRAFIIRHVNGNTKAVKATVDITGPQSGTFRDKPIYEWLESSGIKYHFDGIQESQESRIGIVMHNLKELPDGLLILEPGIRYKPTGEDSKNE